MEIEVVDSIKSEDEIVIFLEEDVDDDFKEKIINSDKKYIALTSRPSDIYEMSPHISTICFPLYCSKIKTAFEELMHPDETPLQKQKKKKVLKGIS